MPISFDDYWRKIVANNPGLSDLDALQMSIPVFCGCMKAAFDEARKGVDVPREPIIGTLTGVFKMEP